MGEGVSTLSNYFLASEKREHRRAAEPGPSGRLGAGSLLAAPAVRSYLSREPSGPFPPPTAKATPVQKRPFT